MMPYLALIVRCVAFCCQSKGNYHFGNFRALETVYYDKRIRKEG